MITPSMLFTRQQVADLTGASDDVLSFWIKNDLIVPTSGGSGKGSHRKFDMFQVNVAAVLVELRRFGVNIGTMRSLARMLQDGVELGRSAECNFRAIYDALNLFDLLELYRGGNEVQVFIDTWDEKAGTNAGYPKVQLATSEQDILEHTRRDQRNLHDQYENIAAFAARITKAARLPLQLFFDLNHLAYRYVWSGNESAWSDAEWLIVPMENGELDVIIGGGQDGFLGNNERQIKSGLFPLPAAIFRSVWGQSLQPILIQELPPSPEELAQRERLEQTRAIRERARAAEVRRLITGADD